MRNSQLGISLIELMIALLLGLVLSLAAVQLLLTNQRTFSLQDAVTSLNEDGQMALRYIAADIRNAGRAGGDIGFTQPVILNLSVENAESELINFAASDGVSGGNDTLAVSYLGLSACQGADLTQAGAQLEGAIVVNRYYVENGSLRCASLRKLGPASGYELLSPESVELLPGVESFQVLYGLDDEKDGGMETKRFVTAAALGVDSVVTSIRIALLIRSNDSTLPVPSGSHTLNVLNETITSPADRAIRRVFTTTANLRNVYWESI